MNRILVIQTASIGDVILATSLVETLHEAFPGANIDFLAKKGMESLFTGHPYLGRVLVLDKKRKFSEFARLLNVLRKKKYDLVINIQRFAFTGMLTALSGAKTTIGFDKNPFSRLFSKRIRHRIEPGIHEADRNFDLIRDIVKIPRRNPRLYPPSDQSLSSIQHPCLPGRQAASGIHYTLSPASLWFTKQYPADRWVELMQRIDPAAGIYLLGSNTDISLCDSIILEAKHPGAVNLAGKLSFLESASLMKGAKMNFTNDSAPMHLASAVDAPVTAIYCSTLPSFGFGPLSADSAVVEIGHPLYCRPCGLHGRKECPEGHFRCATEIDLNNLTSRL